MADTLLKILQQSLEGEVNIGVSYTKTRSVEVYI